jgi:hypothetical protein
MIETVTPADVVAYARHRRAAANAAEVDILDAACSWADLHPADEDFAATYAPPGGDTGIQIAGEGCPTISEFAVHEFAAALTMGTESGKHLIGQALELRHRLPRIWARVRAGEVQVWRARRVAEATIRLSPEAAAHVDRQLARFVHSSKPWQLDRLVAEAIAQHMPETAEATRRQALDRRHVTIETTEVSFEGTCWMTGELDLADAQDLDAALSAGAVALKAAGSEESIDARRSLALGDLARGQAPLDLEAPEPSRTPRKRRVMLHLHLSEQALTDSNVTGSVEEGRLPVTADTIKQWCGASDVIVKPVIDLNVDLAVDGYEVPDRIKEQVALRNRTCVFPYCTRPARALDTDHIHPYDPSGPPGQTSSTNLAPQCRQHHRAKTHAGWAYTQLEPGVFLWRSPLGLAFVRNADGTTDLTPDNWRHRPPPPGRD